MSLAQTPLELGILRFLLGAAEAGFSPGLILYLSFWFRRDGITRALAVFFTAIPLAMVIASPVSALHSLECVMDGSCELALALRSRRSAGHPLRLPDPRCPA